jgi:hypothetical protein
MLVPVDGANPRLRQQVCAFIGPAHLTLFAIRQLTTSFTADSAIELLIGSPLKCRRL